MALPTLIDYTTPAMSDLVNRADWALDPGRAALLVHDLQRYFLRAFAPRCPALAQALESTAAILDAARAAGMPVFYTAQTGSQPPTERGLQGELWGRGMAADPEDTAIVEVVAPRSDEIVLAKHRYSAFARSDLANRLATLRRDQLVITGVYAHIGIAATAYDAFQREIYPFVVADAVADFGAVEHERALAQVASCCGVVVHTSDVVDVLAPESPGTWDDTLRRSLARLLPEETLAAAFAAPDADLFRLGLDSMRAFEMLDRLLDSGVDIDFGEFARTPTVSFLRDQGALLVRS